MVLSDTAIQQAIEDGKLSIDPRPGVEFYDPTSVDLTLDEEFLTWDLNALVAAFGGAPPIDIGNFEWSRLTEGYLRPAAVPEDGCYQLESGSFVLGQTREKVTFSSELAGRVEGKSSLARLGLSVHFAPTIHAGYSGRITLEFHNAGPAPIKLRPGAPICQLIVEPVEGAPTATMEGSRFQDGGQ